MRINNAIKKLMFEHRGELFFPSGLRINRFLDLLKARKMEDSFFKIFPYLLERNFVKKDTIIAEIFYQLKDKNNFFTNGDVNALKLQEKLSKKHSKTFLYKTIKNFGFTPRRPLLQDKIINLIEEKGEELFSKKDNSLQIDKVCEYFPRNSRIIISAKARKLGFRKQKMPPLPKINNDNFQDIVLYKKFLVTFKGDKKTILKTSYFDYDLKITRLTKLFYLSFRKQNSECIKNISLGCRKKIGRLLTTKGGLLALLKQYEEDFTKWKQEIELKNF